MIAKPLVALAALLWAAAPQDPGPKGAGGVDQKAVDAAIARGLQYLRTAGSPGSHREIANGDELILLTFLHAGVPENDLKFQELFKRMMEAPLARTYKVALQAMVLEELERVKHQKRIAQCAQFLVDNQCANGQWSYGGPTEAAEDLGTPTGLGLGSKTGGEGAEPKPPFPGVREKPKVVNRIYVKRTRIGPPAGDNSNSQYAALGLRACFDAGVRFPESVAVAAYNWWFNSIHPEETDKEGRPGVATGGLGTPGGWCYEGRDGHKPYGSMTAGAVGALVICEYIRGQDWRRSAAVKSGLAWLTKHFSVTQNVGPCQHVANPHAFLYYYLYALERVGMLYGTDKIGERYWYPEGAKAILAAQAGNGSWSERPGQDHAHTPVWDTCFAILFLKRATRPLVASGAGNP